MTAGALLRIEEVGLGYNGKIIAEIRGFEIATPEVVALIGPSGSGKSTFLATISGALPSVTGGFSIMGIERSKQWKLKNISRTLQSFPLLHWLTVKENLLLAARIKGVVRCDADNLLASFQATHLANRFPKTLSGGERCRASLAQALVSSPTLLLLDEPLAGLDVAVKEQVATTLFAVVEERKIPVLFVTHDLFDACTYSHRIVVLDKGTPTKVGAILKASEPGVLARVFTMMGGKRHDN